MPTGAHPPGTKLVTETVDLSVEFVAEFGDRQGPYERLLRAAMLGDHFRFTRIDAVLHSWQILEALFGVIQGAQYEDLRKKAASDLGSMSSSGIEFDGFGIGGALDKDSLGTIVGWVNSTLPENKPKHLLGIGAPEDLFVAE